MSKGSMVSGLGSGQRFGICGCWDETAPAAGDRPAVSGPKSPAGAQDCARGVCFSELERGMRFLLGGKVAQPARRRCARLLSSLV